MIKPTLHMNGSSARHLAEDYATAADAIRTAQEKLARSAPNARDYYPQGDDAYRQARAEHEARAAGLQAVYDELRALYEHCRAGVRL